MKTKQPAQFSQEEKIKFLNCVIRHIHDYEKLDAHFYICHYFVKRKITNERTDSRLIKPIFPELYKIIVQGQKERCQRLCPQRPYYEMSGWQDNVERLAAIKKLKKEIKTPK